MSPWIRELVEVLRTEAALYEGLLKTLSAERTALRDGRLDSVERAVAEKQARIQELQAAEEQRRKLVHRLAQGLGCSPEEVTLRRLADCAAPAQGKQLQRLRGRLQDLLAQVRAENQRSLVLCSHAAELLRVSCKTLKGLVSQGPVYQRGGRLAEVNLNGRLVRNEI